MFQSVFKYCAIASLASQLFTFNVHAQTTVVFQNGTNGYQGTTDTMFAEVREEIPLADSNLAGSSVLSAGFDLADPDNGISYAWIQFDDIIGNRPGQIPPDAELTSAVLEMFVSDDGNENTFVVLYNNLMDFDVLTATYNSMGGDIPLGQPFFVPASEPGSVFVEAPGVDDGDVWSADIAPLIQQYMNGLENKGIWIIPDENFVDAMSLVSTEGTLGPTLQIITPNGNFTFQQGLNGYDGLQDAAIRGSASPDTPLGNEPIANIEKDPPPDFNYALIRFDDIFGTGPGQIPPGTPINSATLRVAVINAGANSQVREIIPHTNQQFGVDTFFNEDTVTWNNFIDNGVDIQTGIEVNDSIVGEVDLFGGSRIVEVDVTSSVEKWSNGTLENYGWLIEALGTRNGAIGTKETGNFVPKITATFTGGTTSDVENFELYK